MIVVAGALGEMGQRYQAILARLQKRAQPVDAETTNEGLWFAAKRAKAVILATPTDTHYKQLKRLIPIGKPILCESPLTKDAEELEEILDMARTFGTPLNMIYQMKNAFKMEDSSGSYCTGRTSFDYYKTTSDGMIWDAIQVIGLADQAVELSNESPIWKCTINDVRLDRCNQDKAYVNYVWDWLMSPGDDLEFLKQTHTRTKAIADDNVQ